MPRTCNGNDVITKTGNTDANHNELFDMISNVKENMIVYYLENIPPPPFP